MKFAYRIIALLASVLMTLAVGAADRYPIKPNLAAVINFVEPLTLRALGVTSKQRSPQLPDVPVIIETLPGFEDLGWFGLMAPVGNTPAEFAKAIREETGHGAKIVRARKMLLERRVNKLREIA